METSNINYCQVVDTTFEEKVEIYMKCEKKTLAEMLAMRDIADNILKNNKTVEPYSPDISKLPNQYNNCKSWADCTNPHYDCINCPLKGGISVNKKWEVTCSNCS